MNFRKDTYELARSGEYIALAGFGFISIFSGDLLVTAMPWNGLREQEKSINKIADKMGFARLVRI